MRLRFLTKLIVLGLFVSACTPKPEPTVTPRPTHTPPVALPTPTAVSAVADVGVVVAGAAGSATPLAVKPLPNAPTPLPTPRPTPGSTPTTIVVTPVPVQPSTPTASTVTTVMISPTATATSAPATPVPVIVSTGSIFGVELGTLNAAGGMPQAKTLGARWLRRNALLWGKIEDVQGARNWDAMSALDQELKDASANGFEVILIVRNAPLWAQESPNQQCGPVRADKFAAFGAFMKDAVARYSAAPFNVKYWEIWNEPDGDPSLFTGDPDTVFGCLGNKHDGYYGGGAYGEMLKAIYPQVKAANPNAQVLFGGLLLDCDPVKPPAGKDCLPSKFLEGALRAGAGPFFDGVSFHGYDYFQGEGEFSNANWNAAWNTNGPVVIAKARFIKDVLSKYGVSNKYLMNTEGALLAFGATSTTPTNDVFEYTKVVYAVKLYVAAMAEGLRANVWYNMQGWFLSGLVDKSFKPYLAFTSIQFLAGKLQNAAFVAEQTQFPGIRVYEFLAQGKRIWVVWSQEKTPRALTLPATPRAVYDTFGAAVKSPSQTLTLKEAPFIVELD